MMLARLYSTLSSSGLSEKSVSGEKGRENLAVWLGCSGCLAMVDDIVHPVLGR